MGVDDYRDREGDAEERTGVGQGERVDEVQQDAATDVSGYHDSEGDAEERTGWAATQRASTPRSVRPRTTLTPPEADPLASG